MLKRRDFLRRFGQTAAIAAGAAQLLGAADSPNEAPPNILWLDAEDLCPDLSCYGDPFVHSPNIDRLAAAGVRFTNAYVTGPVCSASRSAMLTGMYQTSIGAHHHRSNRDKPLPEGIRMVTEYLREAGYFVCNGTALRPERGGKTDFNFRVDKPFDGTDWSQRKPGQPFFAQMHFSETHRNFAADKERPVNPAKVTIPPYYPDHPITRMDWALYLETVQILDKKVGQMLDRLEQEGLAENTVVFLTGDHGRPMVRGKQWLYDGGIHVPLIVRWPGRLKPGQVCEDMVSLIDLAPTWTAIAGTNTPDHFQGQNLFGGGEPRTRIYAARDRCDGTDDRIRCIRTRDFKYIRNFRPQQPYTKWNEYKKRQYPVLTLMEILNERGELTPEQAAFMAPYRPVEELYDLREDPHEVRNLAEDPEHAETLKTFRTELDRWICETRDQGQMPEDPREAFAADEIDEEQWARFVEKLGFSPLEEPERYLAWWEDYLRKMKPDYSG